MVLFSGLRAKSADSGGGGDLIKDATAQSFMQDVIEASREVPVIVDFWAPWCGPCKQLGPVLERVVRDARGKVRLVKINVDESPQIAQQLRIQSIPTVYAFANGQPVDGFAGALPESQIKAFVERLAGPIGPGSIESQLEEARLAAEAGDPKRAEKLFGKVLANEPENPVALAGLARAQVARGQVDAARATLERVPAVHANHVEVDGARAALSLAGSAGTVPDPAVVARRLEADPNDHAARLDLATALFLRGQIDAAIEHLLTIIKVDREWNEQAARKRLINFFEALGPTHPATVAGRRQLSAVLFS
jgi:putative thioredoxin